MRLRPEILKLLDSSIPFLGPSGQRIVRSTQSLAELIQSPAAIKAMNTLSLLAEPQDAGTAEVRSPARYNPFSLFLVFYLLVLSADYSHPQTAEAEDSGTGVQLLLPDLRGSAGGDRAVNPT